MSRSPQDAAQITHILATLADAVTAIETRQDEHDRTALQLVQLVGVDIQDITDTHDAQPASGLFDPAGELAEIAAWLSAYHADYPDLTTELTALVNSAAAALRDHATR